MPEAMKEYMRLSLRKLASNPRCHHRCQNRNAERASRSLAWLACLQIRGAPVEEVEPAMDRPTVLCRCPLPRLPFPGAP